MPPYPRKHATSKFTLRTDPTLLRAFQYIAEYNGRSGNREMEMLIKKYVADFEKKHGKIEFNEDQETK